MFSTSSFADPQESWRLRRLVGSMFTLGLQVPTQNHNYDSQHAKLFGYSGPSGPLGLYRQ